MKIIEKILENSPQYKYSEIDEDKIMYFDIETTGLSPYKSVLYLIGAVYKEDNRWKFVQWFADDSEDEAKMIEAFFNILDTKEYLIHYNGNGFDIPYLENKMKQLNIKRSFRNIESIDLYKVGKKIKDLFNLENAKLKTIESFIGINREDKYTGKELIKVYKEFIKIYVLEKLKDNPTYEKSNPLLKDLLLHNEEDIINLLQVTKINYIYDIFNGNTDCLIYENHKIENQKVNEVMYREDVKDEYLVINYRINQNLELPSSIKIEGDGTIVVIEENNVLVKQLIQKKTLKFFYPNYKDYYYLPVEDMAMHKSIATYVDKSHRQKANASNCYIKKQGYYVKTCKETLLPRFSESYESKDYYVSLTDLEVKKYYKDHGFEMLKLF